MATNLKFRHYFAFLLFNRWFVLKPLFFGPKITLCYELLVFVKFYNYLNKILRIIEEITILIRSAYANAYKQKSLKKNLNI